ncbi:PD40 domain-containing protein [Microvirga zambiensis]|uniref:PD40 domain-containing protein n=1 Tax=Microvirga zambiensis TaxID=1402137 RepID=UPI001920201F|nr:PD40 domain-containing protein [Microvirga zambiensis]
MFLTVQSVSKPAADMAPNQISLGEGGVTANGSSIDPQISADGRYILFTSLASNLVYGDTNNTADIFLKDLRTGILERISTAHGGAQANGTSIDASISGDGRYIVFRSNAPNLVHGDNNPGEDLFRKDLSTGAVKLISTNVFGYQAEAPCENPQLSADGRYVVFDSGASSLVNNDTNNGFDIFRKDIVSEQVLRLSTASNGLQANGASKGAHFTPDGRYMVFQSAATNLVTGAVDPNDNNRAYDIFRKDLVTGAVERVSIAGNDVADGESINARISADGRYVIFESTATNLVIDDTNGKRDIFRKDLVTGTIERISAFGNGQANGESRTAQFSVDGRYVIFETRATNLAAGATSSSWDILRKDLVTGGIDRFVGAGGANGYLANAQMSANGRYAVIQSDATNLVPGDGSNNVDIFLYDFFYESYGHEIREGRFLEVKLGTGAASSATISWGDGTSSSVTPTAGSAAFHHAYATTGIKAASVTLVEGALEWKVPHTVNVTAGTMARNTVLADTLSGGAGTDSLTGDAFANILIGNGGNDRLIGGLGVDTLTGSKGKDVFVFDDKETGSSKSKADYILDFKGKEGDKIDLKLVDADTKKKGDQKFSFIGDKAFTKAGQVRVEKTKKETFVYLNTDNDKAAEAVIKLKGSIDLSKGWFVL